MKIKIGIVDDHRLFLKSLVLLIENYNNYEVIVDAIHGKDLMFKIQNMKVLPDIMLIDVDMPVMDGQQTTKWLQKEFPEIKPVALSVKDDENSILKMLKAGCCAYLLKDIDPNEFEKALNDIWSKGYYNGDASNLSFIRQLRNEKENVTIVLNQEEKTLLQLICSELPYKIIAIQMDLSERRIDYMREHLFQKFNVQTRIGLCMEAIRKGYIDVKPE